MHHIFFIHSSIDGHLGCFQIFLFLFLGFVFVENIL